MSAIANYGELRMALSDHVGHRNISSVLPRLVQTAESKLNRDLRTRFQLTSASLTFVSGTVALPADFLEMSDVYGLNGHRYRAGPVSDSQRQGSMFSRYSIQGANILINGFNGARSFDYYAKLPTLTTSSVTTNWLLDRYPDVYLYAVGLEAAIYLKDMDLVAVSKEMLKDAINTLKVDDDRSRWANTTVRVAGITP